VNWFTWRQHRKQFLIFGVLLALFAALLIPTGLHFWHAYQTASSACAQARGNLGCDDIQTAIFGSRLAGAVANTVIMGGFAAPLLLGLFVGSPLLAREYEDGTNKLAWTQSVSRRKWLLAKLLWILAFAVLYGLAITLLTTWWSHTLNVLQQSRFVQGHFETQGLMPIAYSLFFTAIGITAGAWFRKTLVALGITLTTFVLCMVVFAQVIRPHYMAPTTITSRIGDKTSEGPSGSIWILSRNIVDKNGKTFESFSPANLPANCRAVLEQSEASGNGHGGVRVKAGGGGDIEDCLNAAGYHDVTKYQPAYRYWDFQRIEAGIYLGMTALAIATTYWLVLKRDA
jgi:ABC-type transport system involved in multi-copper enzyme maturation permease subunit